MSRRQAEKMTEVRIDVSRYPSVTEKFREAMSLSGTTTYVHVVINALNEYLAKLRRQQALQERRK